LPGVPTRRSPRSRRPCGRRGRRPMRAVDHSDPSPSGTRSPGFAPQRSRFHSAPGGTRPKRFRPGRARCVEVADHRHRLLLRAHGGWPSTHCDGEQNCEIAASHVQPLDLAPSRDYGSETISDRRWMIGGLPPIDDDPRPAHGVRAGNPQSGLTCQIGCTSSHRHFNVGKCYLRDHANGSARLERHPSCSPTETRSAPLL
jgi:hypothetical protein